MRRIRGLLIVPRSPRKASLRVRDLRINDPKDLVHLLERHALGLGNKEPREEEHREAEAAVDEVRPVPGVADRGHHVRGGAGDDEVEQPLRRGRQRDVGRAETRCRDLRDVDPAHRAPAELEEGREQEDHDDGDVARWRHRDAGLGRVEAHVEADVEHGGSLRDGGPEKGFAPTQSVGDEEEEDGARSHLHDSVDTGGKETGFSPVETKICLPTTYTYQSCVLTHSLLTPEGNLQRSGEHSS